LDFSRSLDSQVDSFIATNDGAIADDNIFFLGDIPANRLDNFRSNTETRPMLSASTLHFNANHNILSRAEVRQALSLALDRNHIAGIVGLDVNPATGIVPIGIIGETATGGDFREGSVELIHPAGDMSRARSLLQSAGASSGSFELKVRDDPVDLAVAEYIAGVWNQLGFNVTVSPARGRAYADAIHGADYDVMLYDFQAPGVCAWSVLAPFAVPFSGSAKEFNPDGGFYEDAPYMTGFRNEAYDALIEEIFLIDDRRERHERLMQAERMLVDLAPIAPLYFHTSINITEMISGITFSRFGFPVFTRANLRNHQEFTTTATPRVFIE
jgi:dipeptide transport system substrate-binding protein